ncbi:YgcG family protein [Methylomicrobium sp. Wu6]|uniref:TPM domain-containing protein n=1 Tax=Methylomicrobium sp. Wu6 TaxID=3107928 RepID=UPI002DD62FB8|nr:YgcG family protein [Methylomicrobium sp. Wu6]MEC4747103.1 YgcG family protein [Methylomicrobium sp. Wu6]
MLIHIAGPLTLSRQRGTNCRKDRSTLKAIFGLILLLFIDIVSAQLAIPDLSKRVSDLTGTLTAIQTNTLENRLAAFEQEKGSQIAVLIIATTQPEDIAAYGIRVAEAWKIGRKKIDDGVIMIVAKNDRRLRLEVGYGLEGVIPDAVAKRIIAETITPYFKQGDFAAGIDAGVTQIMALIKGEALPAPQESTEKAPSESTFLFLLAAGLIVGFILSLMLGRPMAGLIAGFGSTAVAALFFGLGFAIFLGILVFFMIIGGNRYSGWSSGGGYHSGGGGSWGGGGGGFGGGGASGSW